jgi:hypothetical protein
MDADDLRDYLEQDIVPPNVLKLLDHMPVSFQACCMPDWINMTQDKYNKSSEALPLPAVGPAPPGISLELALKVSYHMLMHQYNFIGYYIGSYMETHRTGPIWKHIGPYIQGQISHTTWYPILYTICDIRV